MRRLSDPLIHWQEYATFTSDIDLGSAFVGYTPVVVDVLEAGAGSLVVRTVGVPGSDTTWSVADGQRIECRLNTIKSATDVGRVRVGFSDAK